MTGLFPFECFVALDIGFELVAVDWYAAAAVADWTGFVAGWTAAVDWHTVLTAAAAVDSKAGADWTGFVAGWTAADDSRAALTVAAVDSKADADWTGFAAGWTVAEAAAEYIDFVAHSLDADSPSADSVDIDESIAVASYR